MADVALAPAPRILKVNYGLRPSLIPSVERGVQPSITRPILAKHPDRKDMMDLDMRNFYLLAIVEPEELGVWGHKYLERLESRKKTVLDIRVMEELLKNQEFIPEGCKNRVTLFPATEFEDKYGDRVIAGFTWNGLRYAYYLYYLRLAFYSRHLVAYLAD